MTGGFLDAAIRASVFLAPALIWVLLSRRTSAAVRHAVCFLALLVALTMPILSATVPSIRLALLPAGADLTGEAAAAIGGTGWPTLLLATWLAGALIFSGKTLGGVARARALCRWARPVTDARVLSAVIRARRELGLATPIRVRAQRRLTVPLTWGVFRPVILLPRGAKHWSRGRLRAVLLHELSHVRRRDCLTQLVADLTCAVYWFHPLVWLAALRMRVERERACDDAVVVVGGRPSGYAVLLLRMVKGIHAAGPAARLSPAATFADGGGMAGRLQALLGRARERGSLTPAAAVAFALGALTLALPVAAIELCRQPGTEPGSATVATRTVETVAEPSPTDPTARPPDVEFTLPRLPAVRRAPKPTPELLEALTTRARVSRLTDRPVKLHPAKSDRRRTPSLPVGFFGGFLVYVQFPMPDARPEPDSDPEPDRRR